MKKQLRLFILMAGLTLTTASYANWYQDIINAINAQGNITNGFLSNMNSQQGAILASQQDIENLMKDVQQGIVGHSGWGTYNFHDYQSYGDGARDWSSVLQTNEPGGEEPLVGTR